MAAYFKRATRTAFSDGDLLAPSADAARIDGGMRFVAQLPAVCAGRGSRRTRRIWRSCEQEKTSPAKTEGDSQDERQR